MVSSIATTLFLGKPIIVYAGAITFLSLLCTAIVGLLNMKGIRAIPFRWHPRLAVVTIIMATLHAILGLSLFFRF